ncbi:hypothetical protein [Thermoflexus sp.]|uniref:glycosyltransferase family 39 protein n=1 Tax=Thermoflexus sp. TaxID=1969742 RepID=UPI0035E45CC3
MPIAWLVLLTAISLNRLHIPSLWFDEGWSWHLARMPIPEMLRTTAADRSPFLYYLLLHLWIRIAGESEFALRWPSVAFGLLTAALAGRIAARGWGWPAGILTMLAMGLSPFWLYYVQEARMYAMLAAGALAAFEGMEAILRKPTSLRFLIWTLLAAGTILTHYYGLFPAAAMAIGLGLGSARCSGARRRWAASMLGLLGLIGPWLIFARERFVRPEDFLRPPATLLGILSALAHGFWPGEGTWLLAAILAPAALLRWNAFARRWAALTLGTMALTVATLVTVFPRFALFHPRYGIFLWALWVIGIGGGAARLGELLGARIPGLPRRAGGWIGALFLLPLGAMLLGPWWTWWADPGRGRDPYREAVAHVARQIRPGEAALALRANWAVLYYWNRMGISAPLLMGPASPVWEEEAVRTWLEDAHRRYGPPDRPWRLWFFGWQQNVVDPLGLFDGLLLENGFEVGGQPFGSLWVAYYETWPPFHGRPLTPRKADFDGKVELRGVHLRQPRWPGDLLGVTLAWARVGPIPRSPQMFIHVLDPAGRLVAQQDGPLPNDLMPISTWPLDHPFPVFTRVILPRDLHGLYRIRVGLYDPRSGARWPVRVDGSLGDGVEVGVLEIP